MLKEKTESVDVGIIVGRFHVDELHSGHKEVINTVRANHDKTIVILGVSPLRNTTVNPLDYRCRFALFREEFPDVEVHYLKNNRDDAVWSKNLDKLIGEFLVPTQKAILYGSRDSFINSYSGKYPTKELESKTFISGTEIRRKIINSHPATKDFRAGMIAATATHYPTAYQTVDIAILDEKGNILLVRKPDEVLFRFCGGFSDPKSNSLEDDAKREVFEETGVEIGGAKYIGSTLIDDWRYRGEVDKIKTALFVANYAFGRPEGADDVAEARWFSLAALKKEDIVYEHGVLFDMLMKYLNK